MTAPVGWRTRWAFGAVLAAAYLAMLTLTWGKWPDAQVDFGHELYTAWQIAEGRVFGHDLRLVATGPLSPHVNALLFSVFGAELRVLVAFNLLVLALLTWLLHAIVSAVSDRLTGTIACAVFLALFAFGQYGDVGNYNYITPYSHGATHGLALALLSVWLLYRHSIQRRQRLLLAAGLAVGLVSLTKPEISVAAVVSAGAWWCARARTSEDVPDRQYGALVVLVMAAFPPAIAMAIAWRRLPLPEAWQAIATPWTLMATPFARTPFYVAGMGLDAPARNLGAVAGWVTSGALLVIIGVAAEVAARRLRVSPRAAGLVTFSVTLVALAFLVPTSVWLDIGRPLPAIALAGVVGYAAHVRGTRCTDASRERASLGLALSVLALVLLGKMILNARIFHYGFALAMPAFMLVVVWSWWSVPTFLRERGLNGGAFRGLAGAVIVLVVTVHVKVTLAAYEEKRIRVGAAGNAFVSNERGTLVNEAVRLIARLGYSGETLTVLPEGAMINFLTRRSTPSPYLAYTPEMIAGFGEEAMLAPLRRAPPDHVVLVSRDASEYGARTFGRDYGLQIMRWVERNYTPVASAGGSPMVPGEMGVVLLERNLPVAGSPAPGDAGRSR